MPNVTLQTIFPFVIALIIGFLIGIERERSHANMGVRTFILIALQGTLAAWLENTLLTLVLSFFVLAIILLGYLRFTANGRQSKDIGITTELSGAIVFCLGFLAVKNPLLACTIGTILLLVLSTRKRLHEFSRHIVKTSEVQAVIILIFLAIGVSLLPNHTIDPWELFNPRRFGILVLLIASIQFGGYVAIRLFGHQFGMAFTGFFGGLVSSTAVFLTLAKPQRGHLLPIRSLLTAAILATIAMLVEFTIIVYTVSPKLINIFLAPVISMSILGVAITLFLTHRQLTPPALPESINPLDLKSILKLGSLLFAMLIIMAVAIRYIGVENTALISFVGGLIELHSASLATATVYIEGKLSFENAEFFLALGILGAFVSKLMILFFFAKNRFAVLASLSLLSLLLCGYFTYFLVSVGFK